MSQELVAPFDLPPTFVPGMHLTINSELQVYEARNSETEQGYNLWAAKIAEYDHDRGLAITRVSHPNLLPVRGVWYDPKSEWNMVAVETPGPDFAPLSFKLDQPLPFEVVIWIARQIGAALIRCHRLGFYHLRLRPECIWINPAGEVRLEFFSVPGKYRFDSEPGEEVSPWSQVSYQCPEQNSPDFKPGPSADVYALGVIFYELLAGKHPFAAPTLAESIELSRTKDPEPLTALNPLVTPELEKTITGALEKDPAKRWPNLEVFMGLLETQAKARTQEVPLVTPVPKRGLSLQPKTVRKLAKGLLITVLILAVLAGVAALAVVNWPTSSVSSQNGNQDDPFFSAIQKGLTPGTVPTDKPFDPGIPDFTPGPVSRNQSYLNFLQASQLDKLIQDYKVRLSMQPDNPELLRDVGAAAFIRGYEMPDPNAVKLLQKATYFKPDDALAYAYLAGAFYEIGQTADAYEAATTAIKLNPNLAEAQAFLAMTQFKSGSMKEGQEALKQALALDPQNFWTIFAAARMYQTAQDWKKSDALIKGLLALYPSRAFLANVQGEIYRGRGAASYSDARFWFQKALDIDPLCYPATNNLAWLEYITGNYVKAGNMFAQVLDLNPNYPPSLTGMGYLKLRDRDNQEAYELFRRAVNIDKTVAEAYNGLASASLNQGDVTAVANWSDLALQYAPNYADPYYNKGRALYELRDFANAITNLKKAVELDPTRGHYYEALAYAYYADGQKENAKKAGQESLRLKPDNPLLDQLMKLIG